jgi:phytoene dehydrogenase-like protein
MVTKEYDIIIVGGGINSLTAAALSAKKNKSILLLESRDELGGMATLEEFSPGFKCNMVYDYIRWIDPRLIKKLNLYKYGLEFQKVSSLRIALDENKKHIIFQNNPSKTAESITSHSSKDGDKWIEFTQYINKICKFLEPLYTITPPVISKMGIKDALAMSNMLNPIWKHGRRGLIDIIRTIPMMMPELLDEWFESKLLRGSLAASGITNITQGPFSAATVLNFIHHHVHANGKIHNAHFIKGGTHQFAKILSNILKENGVTIQTNTTVKSINCKDGICSSVITSNDQTYNGKIIISGLDPTNTFFKLVGKKNIPPTFKTQLNNIKYRGSTARVHFALKKCPNIPGITIDQHDTIFSINPSEEYLEHSYDDIKYGRISKNPYIEFSIPSLIHPNYAPNGKHVLSSTVQYIPYHLKNQNWNDKLKNEIINNVTNIIGKYIPNFSDLIINSKITTPLDLEKSLGLTEGNLNQGEMTLDQFFFMRPTISTSQYKTPFTNLYLCGCCTHPGGGLHGSNAVNAIREIIK